MFVSILASPPKGRQNPSWFIRPGRSQAQVWAADKHYHQNNRHQERYFLCLLCSELAGYHSMQSKAEQTLQVASKTKKKEGGVDAIIGVLL